VTDPDHDGNPRIAAHFPLGQHRVEILHEADGGLSLRVDGCIRKRRGQHGSAAWLWTNVELPFEDHHLVEVRRRAGDDSRLDIRINGETFEPGSA
jgi:hypothetical protein